MVSSLWPVIEIQISWFKNYLTMLYIGPKIQWLKKKMGESDYLMKRQYPLTMPILDKIVQRKFDLTRHSNLGPKWGQNNITITV